MAVQTCLACKFFRKAIGPHAGACYAKDKFSRWIRKKNVSATNDCRNWKQR